MNQHVVVRSIERADEAVIRGLAESGTATVHEAQGRRGFLGPAIRPIQQDAARAGSAITVLSHPGDNLMVHAAIECCQEGDFLVVANTAGSTHGMFGELIATSLAARGVVGLVIDAGVRDTSALRAMGFAVWSQYVSCQGTVKASPGSVNVPIVIGGSIVNPGDVVVADDDGVVVVPRIDATEVLEKSQRREAKEAEVRERLGSRELGLDIYGLRAVLEDVGVTYVDSV